MRRVLALVVLAGLAVAGLTACMGDDDDGSALERRRAGAIIETANQTAAAELTITGLTPTGVAIDVNSYSWKITNSGGGAVPQLEVLTITKTLDEMSPLLFKGAALGTTYTNAVLKLSKTVSGEAPHTYATYELTNAQITSVTHGGSGGIPTESVSLKFAALKHSFTPQSKGAEKPATTTSFSYQNKS